MYGITYANDTYVTVGADGAMAISTNATSWLAVESGTRFILSDICYGNGTFVVVGHRGLILQSRNFLRPILGMQRNSPALEIVAGPSEFGRQFRVESSASPLFHAATTIHTYSNSHTNIVVHDVPTNGSRYYRVVSP